METTSRDRRALMVLGAVGLVALLLFVLVLHKGGGGETAEATSEAPITTNVVPPAPVATETPAAPGSHSGMVFGGRDPFQTLVVSTGTTTGATSTTSTTGTGGTVTVPAPTVSSPTPAPASSPTPGAAGGSSNVLQGSHVITLKSVSGQPPNQSAKVTIDSTGYTVKAGDEMPYGFQLVKIDGECANFLHRTHPFTLCLPA